MSNAFLSRDRYTLLSGKKVVLAHSSKRERWFLLLALLSHFWIMVDCSITKPAIKSIFLTHFSADALPYVWLFTLPVNFFVVICYNRFLARLGCFRLFLIFSLITVGLHLTSACLVTSVGHLSFFLYVWKDIYIMLMFHQLWSVIHSSITSKRAKYLYGLFFVIGTCGGFLGGSIVSYFPTKWGSEALLLLTAPIYCLLGLSYHFVLKTSALKDPKRPLPETTRKGLCDFRLIFASYPLKLILVIVVLMQFSTTLFEYQFSHFLQGEIPNQDIRTQFQGKLFLLVNGFGLFLQGIATFLLIKFLGAKKCQLLLPLTLLLNVACCLIAPSFSMVTYAFGVVKSFDYSLFSILKEFLYVPLSREEKFKARALIDVFAYRSSKALASLAIIAIPLIFSALKGVLWLLFSLYLVWLVTVYLLTRRFSVVDGQLALIIRGTNSRNDATTQANLP